MAPLLLLLLQLLLVVVVLVVVHGASPDGPVCRDARKPPGEAARQNSAEAEVRVAHTGSWSSSLLLLLLLLSDAEVEEQLPQHQQQPAPPRCCPPLDTEGTTPRSHAHEH